jgi:peptide-methionine (S)-S-oxide reductase
MGLFFIAEAGKTDGGNESMKIMKRVVVPLLAVLVVGGIFFLARPLFTQQEISITEKSMGEKNSGQTELATFGGGCFWCLEAVYERIEGVVAAVSGYAGGTTENPSYEEVCTGTTGHAEVVQIEYDPKKATYEELLELFWKAHDPTTLNRQGADVGTQYRSIILYHDEDQRKRAERSKAETAKQFEDPIVTEIVRIEAFYPAEPYHQDFYEKNPMYGYCRIVIAPKLKKLGFEGN